MEKRESRIRRARRGRSTIKRLKMPRLCVHRTPNHIYVQLISGEGNQVLACASTLDKALRKSLKHGGNVKAAQEVGKLISERAKKAGVTNVAFDRSGYKYHGRIKALADAAREHGLEF